MDVDGVWLHVDGKLPAYCVQTVCTKLQFWWHVSIHSFHIYCIQFSMPGLASCGLFCMVIYWTFGREIRHGVFLVSGITGWLWTLGSLPLVNLGLSQVSDPHHSSLPELRIGLDHSFEAICIFSLVTSSHIPEFERVLVWSPKLISQCTRVVGGSVPVQKILLQPCEIWNLNLSKTGFGTGLE